MIQKLKKLQTYCGVVNFETFATAYKIHNNQYGHLHLHKSLKVALFQKIKVDQKFDSQPQSSMRQNRQLFI